ncbi:hypothetical protein ABZV34_27515 [Streptomyces sp. NPDC005195]|uniref:hypothetical protein n=1 Tax=Streptomyces sp. NPDC005195 TaxID=3154561 RepID=UPI0033AB7973
MLNSIDTAAVIRDGGAVGRYPDQIHDAVGWWLGACMVVTTQISRLAVAHDGHPVSVRFAHKLCQGAINAQHYACNVRYLGDQPEPELLALATGPLEASAAWISTSPAADRDTVQIRLYAKDGKLLDETTGLAGIRDLIDRDRVPIPVNSRAKGTIEGWPSEATTEARP